MDLTTALRVFKSLEEPRYQLPEITVDFPVFHVRLDAIADAESEERSFRIFVRLDKGLVRTFVAEDHLRAILDVAVENGVTPTIENNGIELA